MARNYAAVPHEYLEEMAELTDEQFGRLMRALLRYSRSGEAICLEGNERFYAARVKAMEDRHQKSYDEAAERHRQRAQAAANARWEKKDAAYPQNKRKSSVPKRDDSWMDEYW
ncbi:MAG: hypothetical protein J5449_05005 [Oscillospiraceae bacterium]|nr:hypothetical protein [Oscillospiraceae bacterium]